MAQLDAFSRAGAEFGGAISADSTRVVFSGDGFDTGIGLILASVSIAYQQMIQRAYSIADNKTYLIIGRTAGNAGFGGLFGPNKLHLGFYQKFGNGCLADQNNLTLIAQAGCQVSAAGSNDATSLEGAFNATIKHCVIQSLQIGIESQGMAINKQIAMMFNALIM